MLYIQWYQNQTLVPSLSLEMLVFEGKFQAVSKFGEGKPTVIYFSSSHLSILCLGIFLQRESSFAETRSDINRDVTGGQWHKVSWELKEGELTVQLDELSLILNVDVSLTLLHQQDPMVTVYIGARPLVPGSYKTVISSIRVYS